MADALDELPPGYQFVKVYPKHYWWSKEFMVVDGQGVCVFMGCLREGLTDWGQAVKSMWRRYEDARSTDSSQME